MKMRKTTNGWVAVLVLLGGCATHAGRGAAVGSASGAAVGAGAGALAGGGKGALLGAGIGAAAGAGAGALIGRYMDRQAAAMRRDVKSAEIERQGDKVVVRFNSQILFDVDRAELRPQSRTDLGELARVLKQYPDTDLKVEGYTDSTGAAGYNDELSWKRAKAVVDFLASEGVARGRLAAQGYGERQPAASNSTAEGRRLNRRVQIDIAPNQELRRRASSASRVTTVPRTRTAVR